MLTIEQINKLEKENAELKAQKDKYYQQTLDDEIQINELYQEIKQLKTIVYGKSETVRPTICVADDVYKAAIISNVLYKKVLQEIKAIAENAESKLHCCCDITDMLVEIEELIEKAEV